MVEWKENPLGKRGSETGRAAEKMPRADLRLAVSQNMASKSGKQKKDINLEGTKLRIHCK